MSHEEILPFSQLDRTVYVREVAVKELPKEVRESLDQDLIYAVHNSEGERLALVKERELAFDLARQNSLSPVAVH